ncbi:hypothetical protein VUR80DRAFT_6014 [Thermomyces stellatus]
MSNCFRDDSEPNSQPDHCSTSQSLKTTETQLGGFPVSTDEQLGPKQDGRRVRPAAVVGQSRHFTRPKTHHSTENNRPFCPKLSKNNILSTPYCVDASGPPACEPHAQKAFGTKTKRAAPIGPSTGKDPCGSLLLPTNAREVPPEVRSPRATLSMGG